jgi:hypothetical protein
MEDRDLVIVGIALRDAGHRLVVGDDPRRVRDVVALVVRADRRDQVALTRGRLGRE